ncbi:MAG: PQQ-binding-like beta-propeller repeat protein [Planctomycetales bacterium]
MPPGMNDETLIAAIREGDQTAFAQLLAAHQREIHAVVRGRVGEPQVAAELTRQVFLEFLLARKKHSAGLSLRVVLRQLAQQVLQEHADAPGRNDPNEWLARSLDRDREHPPEPAATPKELWPALDDSLARLNSGERQALELFYSADRPLAEIAQQLKRSEAAVQTLLTQGKAGLREGKATTSADSGHELPFAEQVALEERLTFRLGRLEIPPFEVWKAADHARKARRRRTWGGLVAMVIAALLIVGAYVANSPSPPLEIADRQARESDRRAAASEEPTTGAAAAPQESADNGTTVPQPRDRDEPSEPNEPNEPDGTLVADQGPPVEPSGDEEEPASPMPSERPGDKPSPVDIAVAPQWPELNPDGPPQPWKKTIFQDQIQAGAGLGQKQLARWLGVVPGQLSQFTEARRGDLPVAGFEGLVRWQAPWPEDAVLRLAPFDHSGLALHFWKGTEGVTFCYFETPRSGWAAYRTTREGDTPRPSRYMLVGADNDRYDRTLRGAVEIRYQKGTLVLSRGDLRLLTATFSGPPSELYFDKRAWFRSLTMYRGEPLPDEPEVKGVHLLPQAPPARQEWGGELPAGATVTRLPNGGVRLTREKDAPFAWTGVKIPRSGLYEVVLQLGEATPGTGLFMASAAGKANYLLAILRDQKTGAPLLGYRLPDANGFDAIADVTTQVVPFTGPGLWVRIVPGAGTVKCWVSDDGRHWGRPLNPVRGVRDGFSLVGLVGLQQGIPSQIEIQQLEVRELSELVALADPKLLERVPPELAKVTSSFPAWCGQVLAQQPPDVNPVAWRMACAVRVLSRGEVGDQGLRILSGLLEDSFGSGQSPEDLLRLLDQAALAYDAWDPPDGERFARLYERCGELLIERGDPRPYSLPGRSLLANALWTTAPYQTMPEALVRSEIVGLVYADRWSELLELSQRIKFWNRPGPPDKTWPESRQKLRRLVEWSELAARDRLGLSGPQTPDAAPGGLRLAHPVIPPLSRDGLGLLADLQATLADAQYPAACRIIQSIQPEQMPGLAPHPTDPSLFESLWPAVARAMQEHPAWRETMNEQFAPLAKARLQQAIARDSVQEVRAVALQFCGTPSAALACRWLGDRALAEGKIHLALAEFERGRGMSAPADVSGFEVRERLAAALLGFETPPAQTPAESLTDWRMTPQQFDELIAELIQRDAPVAAEEVPAAPNISQEELVAWQVRAIGEWKGQTGQPTVDPSSGPIDWAARQLSCTAWGERLFISNRLQVEAYRLQTGKRLWHWEIQAGEEQGRKRWPLLAMRPVITPHRMFLAAALRDNVALVCLDTANGKEQWRTDPQLNLCSDPLVVMQQLLCFSTNGLPKDRLWQLDLTAIDPQTGEVTRQTPLMEILSDSDRRLSCQVAVVGSRLIGAIGGTVFCCDSSGRPLWLRRQTWVPVAADASAGECEYAPPWIIGQRALVMQPGVLELICLDVATGHQHWRLPLSNPRRLLGADERHVYVETSQGIVACSLEEGKEVWTHPVQHQLDAYRLEEDGLLLYTRREMLPNGRSRPLMVWIDTQNGQEVALWPLAELEDAVPLLGPLISHKDQLWTLFGKGMGAGPRTICQLTPTSNPALPSHADPERVEAWSAADSDPRLRLLAARFFPDWSQLGGATDPASGIRKEFQGEPLVLATRAAADRPAFFTRQIHVDRGAQQPRLVIRAAHEVHEQWTLGVFVGGRNLLTAPVDAANVKKQWGRWEVDLSQFTGKTIRLVVAQRAGEQPAWGIWKELELIQGP